VNPDVRALSLSLDRNLPTVVAVVAGLFAIVKFLRRAYDNKWTIWDVVFIVAAAVTCAALLVYVTHQHPTDG
jgi:hypothetical protein